MFDAYRSSSMGVYGMLRHFFDLHANRPEVEAQKSSFDHACAVVDLIMLAKRDVIGMTDASRRLRAAVAMYITRHVAAYGTDFIKPKMHWLFRHSISI